MTSTGVAALDHSIDVTNAWLADLATEIGTTDRRIAYQALRGWLHTLRDRLTVAAASHFAAQLPELLRGVFYDGWTPARVPVKYNPDEYVATFARDANIKDADVLLPLAAVTRCVRRRMSQGTLDHTFAQLPPQIRALLEPREEVAAAGNAADPTDG